MTGVLLCSSPSCSARLVVPADADPTRLFRFMASRSWTFQVQTGDDRPRPYCGRCRL